MNKNDALIYLLQKNDISEYKKASLINTLINMSLDLDNSNNVKLIKYITETKNLNLLIVLLQYNNFNVSINENFLIKWLLQQNNNYYLKNVVCHNTFNISYLDEKDLFYIANLFTEYTSKYINQWLIPTFYMHNENIVLNKYQFTNVLYSYIAKNDDERLDKLCENKTYDTYINDYDVIHNIFMKTVRTRNYMLIEKVLSRFNMDFNYRNGEAVIYIASNEGTNNINKLFDYIVNHSTFDPRVNNGYLTSKLYVKLRFNRDKYLQCLVHPLADPLSRRCIALYKAYKTDDQIVIDYIMAHNRFNPYNVKRANIFRKNKRIDHGKLCSKLIWSIIRILYISWYKPSKTGVIYFSRDNLDLYVLNNIIGIVKELIEEDLCICE